MKRLIISMILLISYLSVSYSNQLTDTPPEWWDKLSDTDKYKYFKAATDGLTEATKELEKAKSSIEKKNNNIDLLLDDLDKTNKILKNKWYPNFGFNLMILGGIDEKLNKDIYVNILCNKYFLHGRLKLDFGGGVKIYDKLGGSLVLGLGFNL